MLDNEIYFKASRRKSACSDLHRKILKDPCEHDLMKHADHAIAVNVGGNTVWIDCDNKTGMFRLFW